MNKVNVILSNLIKIDLLTGVRIKSRQDLIRLGKGASWIIPATLIKKESICYLVGAGEDITFDVDLANKYSDHVFIFDPTPRAKKHYENVCSNVQTALVQKTNIVSKATLQKIKFIERGLWSNDCEMKFFAPKDPGHVSHSLLNLQGTKDFFIAKVNRLSSLMNELKHDSLDLLKIDIEGAEYEVIKTILEDKIFIRILCVEFDEAYNPLDGKYAFRIKSAISSLINHGYELVALSSWGNYTFLKVT